MKHQLITQIFKELTSTLTMPKEINTIIEGCFPDTPRKLMYSGIEIKIPKNARLLLSEHKIHPNRYLLYAKTKDFLDFEILQNPRFRTNFPSRDIKGGWPLKRFEPNFRWIFDAQRSLTPREGRIYIDAFYFQEQWEWYLSAVQTILKQCGQIFRGEKTEEDFCKNPSPAW